LLVLLGAAVGSSVREAEVLVSVLRREWTPSRKPHDLLLLPMLALVLVLLLPLLLGVQLTTLCLGLACGGGGGHTKASTNDVPLDQ
jgi:hypothetical protein